MRRTVQIAGFGSLALLLLVVGAALRPLIVPEVSRVKPVLDAVEIGFVQDMAEHHQQALAMTMRLSPDVDPAVAALARQIGDSQRTEIGILTGWLQLADAPPTNPEPMSGRETPGHTHGGAVPDESMPGMATTAELDALSAATGRDAEVLFLQLMHLHHLGGIEMAQTADALLASGPVDRMARSMVQEQSQEAGLISILLAERS